MYKFINNNDNVNDNINDIKLFLSKRINCDINKIKITQDNLENNFDISISSKYIFIYFLDEFIQPIMITNMNEHQYKYKKTNNENLKCDLYYGKPDYFIWLDTNYYYHLKNNENKKILYVECDEPYNEGHNVIGVDEPKIHFIDNCETFEEFIYYTDDINTFLNIKLNIDKNVFVSLQYLKISENEKLIEKYKIIQPDSIYLFNNLPVSLAEKS